jgi:hypothetical protein
MGALKVSIQTRDVLMLVVSLLAAACSLCLYVPAVRYRAWAAVWCFGVTLLVFGVISVVMLARVLREGVVTSTFVNRLEVPCPPIFPTSGVSGGP